MWGRKLRAFLVTLTPCTPQQAKTALRGFLTAHIEDIGLGRASFQTFTHTNIEPTPSNRHLIREFEDRALMLISVDFNITEPSVVAPPPYRGMFRHD